MSSGSGSEILAMASTRSLSELSEIETIRLRLDLVSDSRRNLVFLRDVAEAQWLHQRTTIVEAIRRSTLSLSSSILIRVGDV